MNSSPSRRCLRPAGVARKALKVPHGPTPSRARSIASLFKAVMNARLPLQQQSAHSRELQLETLQTDTDP
jgi:hypothetical protein